MPFVNATPAPHAVTVNGTPYTSHVRADLVSQTEGLTTSGLIRTTATISFEEAPNSPFTVDPVESDEWTIGNEIAIDIALENNTTLVEHPRLGKMRILLDPHVVDEVNYQSEVDIGDRLSLIDVDNPASEEAEIDPLVGTSRLNVINALLAAAGIPEGLSNVPAGVLTDTIRYPVQSFEGQSWVELAGILAFNNPGKHCYIYQHRSGEIRVAVYEDVIANPLFTVYAYGESAIGFPLIGTSRVDPRTFEKPTERLRLTGTQTRVSTCGTFGSTVEESISTRGEFDPVRFFGDPTPVVEFRNTTERNLSGNILTETVTREATQVRTGGTSRGLFTTFNLETTNVEIFITTFNSDGLATRRVSTFYQGRFFNLNNPDPLGESFLGEPGQIVNRTTEEWTYDSDMAISSYCFIDERTTFAGPNGTRLPYTPARLVRVRTVALTDYGGYVRTWALNCGQWDQTTIRKGPRNLTQGEIRGSTFTPDVTFGTEQDTPPPAPVERPLGYDLEQNQLEATCEFGPPSGSAYVAREVTDNLQYVHDQQKLEESCLLLQTWKFGRPKGREFEMPCYDELINHDEPFFALNYINARTGDMDLYICESPVWGFNANESIFSATGILIGRVRDGADGPIKSAKKPFAFRARGAGGMVMGGSGTVTRIRFPVLEKGAGGMVMGGSGSGTPLTIGSGAGGMVMGGSGSVFIPPELDLNLSVHWPLNEPVGATQSPPLIKPEAPPSVSVEQGAGGMVMGGSGTGTSLQLGQGAGGMVMGGSGSGTSVNLQSGLAVHWPLNEPGGATQSPPLSTN